jgi:hypothetical protein
MALEVVVFTGQAKQATAGKVHKIIDNEAIKADDADFRWKSAGAILAPPSRQWLAPLAPV